MITRSLDKAKEAYKKKNVRATIAAHNQRAPEVHQQERGKYLKSIIYGGLDGIITTFAVVAGVAGASLNAGVVLILGFANLVADGISMAVGDFLSTKSEQEYHKKERERETWEVDNYPEGEKREMIEIYSEKGIPKKDAKTMVDILAKHKEAWVDVMMVEELGILEDDNSPWGNAIATFLSFALFGFIPLVAYVLARFLGVLEGSTFLAACVLTGLTLFVLGALKVYVTGKSWLRSGTEMLLVGGVAAAAAYGIGAALSGLA